MAGLAGRRVIVAGGTSGIGLAAARLAAEREARIVTTGRNAARVDGALTQSGGAPRGAA